MRADLVGKRCLVVGASSCIGAAEDCVGAFEFLATDRMSGYITGQVIEVNGGQSMP